MYWLVNAPKSSKSSQCISQIFTQSSLGMGVQLFKETTKQCTLHNGKKFEMIMCLSENCYQLRKTLVDKTKTPRNLVDGKQRFSRFRPLFCHLFMTTENVTVRRRRLRTNGLIIWSLKHARAHVAGASPSLTIISGLRVPPPDPPTKTKKKSGQEEKRVYGAEESVSCL